MARSELKLERGDLDRLSAQMERFGAGAGQTVDEVLHGAGAERIRSEIMRLLPQSRRSWRGKAPAAARTQPFTQENGSLSVTVKTKYRYHYLYFPDDGSNTLRHRGERHFMLGGAENSREHIIDACIRRLIENFEEG